MSARVDQILEAAGQDVGDDATEVSACWADEPIFEPTEQTTDFIGRYVDAGATDFTFFLHNPAMGPINDGLVDAHRMATRSQLERTAAEVFPRFRG